jgi:hypothetical protein
MTYKEKQLHFTFCFFNVFRIPNDKHPWKFIWYFSWS